MTTTAYVPSQDTQMAPPIILDRAFFGKDNCLTVQLRGDTCYMKWGKKTSGWQWKNVKFNDTELGEMLLVLSGELSEAKFYHSFNDDSTKIWVSRQDKALILKADDFTKGLQIGEQQVLRVLLERIIWMMNLA